MRFLRKFAKHLGLSNTEGGNMVQGTRLSKLARDLNVGISTLVEFLHKKGFDVDSNPNSRLAPEYVDLLNKEFKSDSEIKKESEKLSRSVKQRKETITIENATDEEIEEEVEEEIIPAPAEPEPKSPTTTIETTVEAEPEVEPKPKKGPVILGKIEIPEKKSKSVAKEEPTAKAETKPEKEEESAPPVETPVEEPKAEKQESAKAETAEPAPQPEAPQEEVPVSNAAEEEVITPAAVEEKPVVEEEKTPEEAPKAEARDNEFKVVGKIDLDSINQKTRPTKKTRKEKEAEKAKSKAEPSKETVEPVQETPPAEKPPVAEETPKVEATPTSDETTAKEEAPVKAKDENFLETKFEKLSGLTVVGKIELPVEDKRKGKQKPVASSSKPDPGQKKKRKRIQKEKIDVPGSKAAADTDKKNKKNPRAAATKKVVKKAEVTDEDVQKQIKDTLARLTTKGKTKAAKHRRQKRDDVRVRAQEEHIREQEESKVLKVNEFVTVSELASMMNIQPVQIISTCMTLGLFVSINQRLDAETMSLVAEEFGFQVSFISLDEEELIHEEVENEADLVSRPPIVTVMGHVDHGKTSLLDYIRNANVIAGEAGGITQHIGAYSVSLKDGRIISFLDTPGHEAFTAMRARGAKITDIVIIVVAADDDVMPQTIEAINHASAASVPIVFAVNKIDKPNANPEKIKEALAAMNYLIEEWGGKYQSQDISAKQGLYIEELLEKVLLEAELLELKANPNKHATGTVIESSLDKGRGYVANILVQTGTLRVGDIMIAGPNFGHVKAMFNERGKKITEAGPSTPVLILGLNGAPQAGDKFNVMGSEREAREIANKREQLIREQGLRTKKHITLDEIGRRIAIGNFQELNIIVKGDVDGSVEALSDSLIKLSTPEIQVNVKHKAVGQISESDVLLAAASDAIIVGFQVRPSMSARKLAEKEEIDIRLYSIIYDAINEMRDAMEGMLSPDIKEEIVATLEIRETFKITKVGTVAGCIVKEGKINRNTRIRLIRDGIVVYTGELGSLKRFKDDVKEVSSGYECGLNIQNFNDIKTGDIIEGYKEVEVRKTL